MLMHLMSSSWSLLWTCWELFHLNGWRSLHMPKFSPLSQAKHKTMAVFFPPCLSVCIVPALSDYIQLVCKNKWQVKELHMEPSTGWGGSFVSEQWLFTQWKSRAHWHAVVITYLKTWTWKVWWLRVEKMISNAPITLSYRTSWVRGLTFHFSPIPILSTW